MSSTWRSGPPRRYRPQTGVSLDLFKQWFFTDQCINSLGRRGYNFEYVIFKYIFHWLTFVAFPVKLSSCKCPEPSLIRRQRSSNGYRNWPRYGLRWSGWYCNPEQHELCRPSRGRLRPLAAGTTSAVPDCSTNHDSADRISGQFLFYHDHNLQKVRETCVFDVPIGVCVTTHDDGTASDVTIGMWRHNQQVTNHERNGKPWFSLPK